MAYAEKLPDQIENDSVDLIFGSHVLHWIDDILKALKEAKRVLKPGGMLVHATGGIIKDKYFDKGVHFINHPAYKLYLEEVKKLLVERKYWDEGDKSLEEFIPTNPKVNPYFNRYTSKEIEELFEEVGFRDMTKTFHKAELDREEMLLRMKPAALSIFVIGGELADKIDEVERGEIANIARKNALKRAEEEAFSTGGINVFDDLDYSPKPEDTTMLYTVIKV